MDVSDSLPISEMLVILGYVRSVLLRKPLNLLQSIATEVEDVSIN